MHRAWSMTMARKVNSTVYQHHCYSGLAPEKICMYQDTLHTLLRILEAQLFQVTGITTTNKQNKGARFLTCCIKPTAEQNYVSRANLNFSFKLSQFLLQMSRPQLSMVACGIFKRVHPVVQPPFYLPVITSNLQHNCNKSSTSHSLLIN